MSNSTVLNEVSEKPVDTPAKAPSPPKPGADILASLVTVVMVFSMIPSMFGMTDYTGTVASLIWILPGFVLLCIALPIMFKQGSTVMACLVGILTGMVLCQMMVRGIIFLCFLTAGTEFPAALMANIELLSGGGFIGGAIYLGAVAILYIKARMRLTGILMIVPTFGFFFLGLGSFGVLSLIVPGFCCLIFFAVNLLYSSIACSALLITGKKILPIF